MIAFYRQHLRNVKCKNHLCLHTTWYDTCRLVNGNIILNLVKYVIKYNIKLLLNEFRGTENVSNIRFQQNKPSRQSNSNVWNSKSIMSTLYSSMQFEKFSFKFFRIKLMKTHYFSLCSWELQNQKPRYFFRSFSLIATFFESGPMPTPWNFLAGPLLPPSCKLGQN